ncbi:MAG: hypothetical protein ACREGD_04970 [Candidatus Saccharimonadales bacterium]
MKTIAFVTVTVIATLVAFYFLPEHAADEPLLATRSETAAPISPPQILDRMGQLADTLPQLQQSNQARAQEQRLRDDRLNNRLAELDTRLRSLENGDRGQPADAVLSVSGEDNTDAAGSEREAEKPESKEISEDELGRWMDETLRAENLDMEATAVATDQVAGSVAKVPGVNLEYMQCSERFCRGTFAHEHGEKLKIDGLLGELPSGTEGFTINEADNRLSVYFTRAGASMDEFRDEAQNAIE